MHALPRVIGQPVKGIPFDDLVLLIDHPVVATGVRHEQRHQNVVQTDIRSLGFIG
ncbi:hypothetical protein D9M73_187900 [compost metagenome]